MHQTVVACNTASRLRVLSAMHQASFLRRTSLRSWRAAAATKTFKHAARRLRTSESPPAVLHRARVRELAGPSASLAGLQGRAGAAGAAAFGGRVLGAATAAKCPRSRSVSSLPVRAGSVLRHAGPILYSAGSCWGKKTTKVKGVPYPMATQLGRAPAADVCVSCVHVYSHYQSTKQIICKKRA